MCWVQKGVVTWCGDKAVPFKATWRGRRRWYIYIYIYVYIHIYEYTCMCIFIYIYIYLEVPLKMTWCGVVEGHHHSTRPTFWIQEMPSFLVFFSKATPAMNDCMLVCMYVDVYVYVCCTCMYVVCPCVCVYVYVCMCACEYVCMYVCAYVCICVRLI